MELTETEKTLIEALRKCKIDKCSILFEDSWDYDDEGLRCDNHTIPIISIKISREASLKSIETIVAVLNNVRI